MPRTLTTARAEYAAICEGAIRLALEGIPLSPEGREQERRTARAYFPKYVIPVLDATSLLENAPEDQATQWATVQLSLGLSGRHRDNVIDQHAHPHEFASEFRLADAYLDKAQAMLAIMSNGWTPRHAALYRQIIEYECETRSGDVHDISSLWRRAASACILLELDLRPRLKDARLIPLQRRYYSLVLLSGDCEEAWKDIRHGPATPVTHLLGDYYDEDGMDFGGIQKQLDWLKSYAHREKTKLAHDLDSAGCHVWSEVLTASMR